MSKHDRNQYAAKAPPADLPATPAGRWYRLRRGKGDFAPYIGADVLEFVNGQPVVKEFVFPTLADIVEGKVVAEMMEGAKK